MTNPTPAELLALIEDEGIPAIVDSKCRLYPASGNWWLQAGTGAKSIRSCDALDIRHGQMRRWIVKKCCLGGVIVQIRFELDRDGDAVCNITVQGVGSFTAATYTEALIATTKELEKIE